MQNKTKNRDIQLDILKGLAIFSVVWGHIDLGLNGRIIYLFHMPFFFILSGYLHRVDPQEGRYFKRKCLSLLLPYFTYLFVLKAPAIVDKMAGIIAAPSGSEAFGFVLYVARLIYGGDGLTGDVGVFWFVTCLFLTQQLFNFVSLRIKSQRVILGLAVGMYILAAVDQIIPGYVRFPWTANVVLGAFPLYVVGAFYGRFLFKSSRRALIGLSAVIAIIAVVLLVLGFELSFRMKLASYGFFILSPLTAFSLTKLLAVSAEWFSKNYWLGAIIAFVGQASLTVMFFHRTVQSTIPDFFYQLPLWLTAVVITAICCAVHELFRQNRFSRALFLGSRQDAVRLLRPITRHLE